MASSKLSLIIYVLLIGSLQPVYLQSLYTVGTLVVSNQKPTHISQSMNSCTATFCAGRVWMYYNDIYMSGRWGTIAAPDVRDYEKQVICRQLGYNMSSTFEKDLNDTFDGPVLLTNLNCSTRNGKYPEHKNILQCQYDLCNESNTKCGHGYDIIVNCTNSVTESPRYHGEVYLCPPKEKPFGMQTVVGLVQLHFDGTQAKSVAIISQLDVATSFKRNKRDTICKDMGFSYSIPDSLHILNASFHYNFTFPPLCINENSWFDVTQLKDCNGIEYESSPCFGCCYDYHQSPKCGYGDDSCSTYHAVIIACAYDPLNGDKSTGNKEICELKKNDKLQDEATTCNRRQGISQTEVGLICGMVLAIAIIFLLIVIIVLLCLSSKNGQRGYTEPLIPNPRE